MKIIIVLDDIRDVIERSGLVPAGYKIEKVEQGSYDKEITIHCEKNELIEKESSILGRQLPGLAPPQRPCVVDGHIGEDI